MITALGQWLYVFMLVARDELGVHCDPGNVMALCAQAIKENTKAANNPLATTWGMPGHDRIFNPIGVRDYDTPYTGIQATVNTLRDGWYPHLLEILRQGYRPQAYVTSPDLYTWGTGNCEPELADVERNYQSALDRPIGLWVASAGVSGQAAQ